MHGLVGRAADLTRHTARLIAARWRVAYNSFMRGARWRRLTYAVVAAALAFLMLVGLGVSYVMTMAVIEFSQAADPAGVIVAAAFTSGLVLSVMVSFTVALAALYLSADLDLLLSAPVPHLSVFVSKLVGGLAPTNVLVLLITLVPLIGYGIGIADHPTTAAAFEGRAYFGTAFAALALLPLLPAAAGALAVMIIVRRVPAHRLGEIVGLVVVAMTLSIALVAGSARELQQAATFEDLVGILARVRSPVSPAEWLTRAVVAAGQSEPATAIRWLGLYAVLSLVLLGLLAFLAERLYYGGWVNMQTASRRSRSRGGRLPWNRLDRAESLSRPGGLLARLPAPAVAVIQKDFRVIPRDLTNMAQVLSPLAIGVFFVLQQLLYPIRIGGADRPQTFAAPVFAMLSTAIAGGISAMITARFGLTAFSLEGRSYWVIKSAPISHRRLLVAKYLVGYLPYLALGMGLVLLLELARAFSDARLAEAAPLPALVGALNVPLLVYAWFIVAVVGAGSQAITLALGTARPNLTWDTPHEMLTPDVGCLSLVLYGLYGFVTVVALAVPAATSGFPMLGHSTLVWLAGLLIGLGVTAVTIAGSYLLAIEELSSVGE